MFNRTLEFLHKQLIVRDEIASEFGSNQTCGSKELATAIQKLDAISPSLRLSEEGLRNLIDLAFKVSLKKEESRYPRFQIYIPSAGFLPIKNNKEPEWMVRFDPPITLEGSTLHRISSGIPPRPYALLVWEAQGTIGVYGIIRIEELIYQDTYAPKRINRCYPGLILSIEGPGILNVSLLPLSASIDRLTLRYGEIGRIYDPCTTPIVSSIYADIEKNIRSSEEGELPPNISHCIGHIWSYILSLTVDFGHGGQFIILPSGHFLEGECFRLAGTEILQVKHTTTKPDLGSQIASLDQDAVSIQQEQTRATYNPFTGEKLPEDNCDSAFKRGISQGLLIAQRTHDRYQALFDSARAVAKLSTADGCLVFDRGLRLLGFKGEVLVRDDPECVELDLDYGDLEQKAAFDINQFGTRHRSAARFCGKVPGAVVFVVSQDGDIRLFAHMDKGKVGIGGPFRPLPGLSPSIVHS